MRQALVFGGSGQIGASLLNLLQNAGWLVTAVSRAPRHDGPGLRWLQGDFSLINELPHAVDAVLSCGPLDLFSYWYAQSSIQSRRVVAFGSTSAEVKQRSCDNDERDVAERLRTGEMRVLDAARARGARATLLRPTLIYGAGRDNTLSRIAAIARRWQRFVLPRNANGLRQPVHVDDLAAAAFAVATSSASMDGTYALPGGETLPYRDMVQRVLQCVHPSPPLIELPSPVFGLLLKAAQASGIATGLNRAAVERMRQDLVFDVEPARRDFGYAPRAFQPSCEALGL